MKASKFDGVIDNTYILFPYKNKPQTKLYKLSTNQEVATTYIPYTENEMIKKFPCAYAYLKSHWDDLETRDMDENVLWYVFGRSQGLSNSGYSKIVFKHVISKSQKHIQVHVIDDDVIVYSGIYITIDPAPFINGGAKKATFNESFYNEELNEVKQLLSSEDFCHYCQLVGKDMSGGYVGISSVFVKNYGTQLTEFPNLPVKVPQSDFSIADQEYMNQLLTEKFADCIKESYVNMAHNGITSTARIKPFHAFLAKALKYKLGQDYEVIADGYSYEKEVGVVGNFDTKTVDVCVMRNGKVLGAIAFKLMSNNFKQNYKNFSEGLLGETAQMKGIGIPYAFCYLIPEKALYREDVNNKTGDGKFAKFDILTQSDIQVYYDIAKDPDYKNRTPDAMFIGIYKLFSDEYMQELQIGDHVNTSSQEYLNGIQPQWSDVDFIKDDDIKNYYLEQFNLGKFLDDLILKMGIKTNE